MNKLRIALEKIVNQPKEVVENGYYGNFEDIIHIATEALKEPTERCYSEEEVRGVLYEAGKLCTFSKEHCLSVVEELIQSLSPKEGKGLIGKNTSD